MFLKCCICKVMLFNVKSMYLPIHLSFISKLVSKFDICQSVVSQ